jgi:hypothetical protein
VEEEIIAKPSLIGTVSCVGILSHLPQIKAALLEFAENLNRPKGYCLRTFLAFQ